MMPGHRYKKEQRRHFVLSVLLPSGLTLLGPFVLPSGWFCWQGMAILVLMWWLVGCLGISVGFHRLFTHCSFSAPRSVRIILGGLGNMAMQGSVLYWTALHRCHHAFSD